MKRPPKTKAHELVYNIGLEDAIIHAVQMRWMSEGEAREYWTAILVELEEMNHQ